MKCVECGHKIQESEHYVLIDDKINCETCFFDHAIEVLDAEEKQKGFEKYEEDDK